MASFLKKKRSGLYIFIGILVVAIVGLFIAWKVGAFHDRMPKQFDTQGGPRSTQVANSEMVENETKDVSYRVGSDAALDMDDQHYVATLKSVDYRDDGALVLSMHYQVKDDFDGTFAPGQILYYKGDVIETTAWFDEDYLSRYDKKARTCDVDYVIQDTEGVGKVLFTPSGHINYKIALEGAKA